MEKGHARISDTIQRISRLYVKHLNGLEKSKVLNEFFYSKLQSFVYAQFITNFFDNLNKKVINEEGLPRGYIGRIRAHFKNTIKITSDSIHNSFNKKTLTKIDYEEFRDTLSRHFPQFLQLLVEIEKDFNMEMIEKLLLDEHTKFINAGKTASLLSRIHLTTLVLEMSIQQGKNLPTTYELGKIIKHFVKDSMPKIAEKLYIEVFSTFGEFKRTHKMQEREFTERLNKRYSELFDLANYFISLSEESGQSKTKRLKKTLTPLKSNALIQIHARALQIAREVLCLLSNGFSDGAIARWRSLYELSVISQFLTVESEEMSERYLDHAIIKAFKNYESYHKSYQKLGFDAFGYKQYSKLRKQKLALSRKYNGDFGYHSGYGWIPQGIKGLGRDFASLEKYVRSNHWQPFYNLASDNIHPGSKGFYRIGLRESFQRKVLLTGKSDYGIVDPYQNTLIHLNIITTCLVTLAPADFEDILYSNVLNLFLTNALQTLVATNTA